MSDKPVKITSALISVYHKTGLDEVVAKLDELGVTIYSTGGTYTWLEEKGIKAEKIEDLTTYPSILGGRVKTLHPKVFGGILGRRENSTDLAEMERYEIPIFDLVIVDLYPFEETVSSGASEEDIIEKIDIGGISLIRAAAKNFEDVLVVPSKLHYADLLEILNNGGKSSQSQRKKMASAAFEVSSHYDSQIFRHLSGKKNTGQKALRYGENPHQRAWFEGSLDEYFKQLHGKELSYNNLVDVDAAVNLLHEFSEPAVVIIKHTNPCGVATSTDIKKAWEKAYAADTVSAFGGIIASNKSIDPAAAEELDKIFFEICIAPAYSEEGFKLLSRKKNRILLQIIEWPPVSLQKKTILGGSLIQDPDNHTETEKDLSFVTEAKPSPELIKDMLFANIVVKHGKSNTIVLAKNSQLIGIGVGQTSRVDALDQAIAKAHKFGLDPAGSVMASDAFFPFPDCVEIAHKAGISAVVQPGGSVRDQDSIDYCNEHKLPMALTGYRHFKH